MSKLTRHPNYNFLDRVNERLIPGHPAAMKAKHAHLAFIVWEQSKTMEDWKKFQKKYGMMIYIEQQSLLSKSR